MYQYCTITEVDNEIVVTPFNKGEVLPFAQVSNPNTLTMEVEEWSPMKIKLRKRPKGTRPKNTGKVELGRWPFVRADLFKTRVKIDIGFSHAEAALAEREMRRNMKSIFSSVRQSIEQHTWETTCGA